MRSTRRVQRGFTIAEGAIGVVLVAGLLVSAISTAGVQAKSRALAADRIRAEGLAHDLMAEVVQMPYADQDDLLELFGRGVLEILGSRPTYDDVDDYNGHSESPPKDGTGAEMTDFAGWSRTVAVKRIEEDGEVVSSETGLKQVTVTVSKGSKVLVTLVAVRSAAWDVGVEADADAGGEDGGVIEDVLGGLGGLLGGK